ncbi:MAG TPA: DUF599 family protein [Burkholderiales bacterium]|nr:DUF599 family protein [Burkholderiales bacterium]
MPTMDLPFSDFIGLIWFVALWVCYTVYTDSGRPRAHSLRAAMHTNRYRWMLQILKREGRIVDAAILGQLSQGASFFASTTLLILVGLFTLLGATDEAVVALRQIPFTGKMSLLQWELRLLVLIVVFVHAFFKFTWAMRQFNYCAVMIGAAPVELNRHDPEFVERAAWLNTLANKDLNQGLRAYYLGLAVLAWFVNVWAFMATTVLVIAVLYHREFHSEALRTLEYPASGDNGKK